MCSRCCSKKQETADSFSAPVAGQVPEPGPWPGNGSLNLKEEDQQEPEDEGAEPEKEQEAGPSLHLVKYALILKSNESSRYT